MSSSASPSLGRTSFRWAFALPLVGLCGCAQVVLTSAFLLRGMETPAEFDELKNKKTVVVCRPLIELQYSGADAPDRIARVLGAKMVSRGKKISIVPPDKVDDWTDEHDWEEFPEVGKALKADYVVGLELEDFSLYQGQTIYQGRASVHITVHDMSKDGDVVYEKMLTRVVYPPHGGVPTSEKTEAQFRAEFINVLTERIGRSFYGHDHRDDYAMDSRTLD